MTLLQEIEKAKIEVMKQGREPSRVYLGYDQVHELVTWLERTWYTQGRPKRATVCGLEIFRVKEDSHLEVY